MFVWRDLDTKIALKRLNILHVLSLLPLFVAITFTFYFNFLSYSFSFFTGYGLFEYTSLGIKRGGELVIPVITSTTVFIVALLFISLPLVVIGTWTAPFTRPFKDVKGFEKFGKVREEIKSFIVQLSNKEKLIVVAFTLTSILAYLFASLWFTVQFGMLPPYFSSFLLFLFLINLLGFLYFGSRIEGVLKRYLETVKV
ncbi:MAG: hypothetical protein ACTSP1_10590 [Candidatus Freyarchaeota archaeon]